MIIKPSDMNIGSEVPDFTLYNTEKQAVSLSDYKGKNVLLLFFPLAFTSTCTKELCSVRDNLTMYNGLNVQVLGISVDSLYTLAKYKESLNINFPLLSDFNKKVSKDYNTLYPVFSFEMEGVSKRSAFVIDKDGVLRYIEILENAGEVPDFEAISRVLNTLNKEKL
jgi:glutaredoxin-dependent peroxiredoxin